MEKGHPFYKYYYGDVKEVIKEQENKVRFNFTTNTNKELVLIVGQLPVLPKHYWENKNLKKHLWKFQLEVVHIKLNHLIVEDQLLMN